MAVKGKWVIPVDNIPDHQSTHIYIFENTDIMQKIARFKNYDLPGHLELPLNFDCEALKHDVLKAIEEYGLHAFTYGGRETEKDVYMSASLTWNPLAKDRISDNPHQATLGSKFHKHGSASLYGVKGSDKNTYTDSMSFNVHTPLAQFGKVGELVGSFKRTLIRSRLSSLIGGRTESTRFNFGWHNDELIFINLRVNIPVVSSPNYAIQVITEQAEESFKIEEFELKVGNAYVYDTRKNHRPFCRKLTTEDRINMIMGVSPWFDFDREQNCWISNEYYGEVHPFDMFRQGLICGLINERR